ncbi:MAG: alkaline phosphatase family protein [Oligoflexia bacterium]|nr:alkaline phosphatase family protein [Oligoflexia bacterium]
MHIGSSLVSWSALGLTLLLCGCGGVPKSPVVYSSELRFQPETSRVLLFSFDGLRPDAIERAGAVHLRSLQDTGVWTRARSVLPSITLVNHASMVSGVSPAKHGISWNSYEPQLGTITVPTVFELARRKGLVTALVAGKEKFRHLDRPGSLDRFVLQEGSPYAVAKDAVRVFREVRPQLMMVHFRHPDSEGHGNGWLSEDQLEAIAEDDQAMGFILNSLKDEGLLESTTVIATADHGGEGRTHGGDSEADCAIPWIAVGAEVPNGSLLGVPVLQYDTAATIADLLELDPVPEWDGSSVLAREPVPEPRLITRRPKRHRAVRASPGAGA